MKIKFICDFCNKEEVTEVPPNGHLPSIMKEFGVYHSICPGCEQLAVHLLKEHFQL